MFGRSDDSKDDRAEQKQHEQNQPDPGRSQLQIGQAHRYCIHAHHHQPRATQASLSHQAIWWRGDGHPAFNRDRSARRDDELESAGERSQ